MSWLFQVMLNYLFIILPVYTLSLGMAATDVGQMFAVNIGARFFPNMLVTKMGTSSELPMWGLTLVGFLVSYVWPEQTWALYVVSAGAGCGFTRACVSLHTQKACRGNVDELTIASKRCGAARSLGDISGFVLPPLAYKFAGWEGFTILGAALTALYLLMSIKQLTREGGQDAWEATEAGREMQLAMDVKEAELQSESDCSNSFKEEDIVVKGRPTAWIDWAISAAFISTELQMNLFITAVPQALLRHYDVPPTYVGAVVAAGALATLAYIMALPFMPTLFNQHRPVNLILTYTGMFAGWVLMYLALGQPYALGFMAAAYFYQSMVGASQIVMLECLTGICDAGNAARILGFAEMVGCAFGMLGGYAGEALLIYGISAPFLIGLAWTFFSVLFLTLSFVLRQTQRDRCSLEPTKSKGAEEKLMMCMASGVNRMVLERANSFISSELQYRQPPTEAENFIDVGDCKPCDAA